MTKCSGKSSGKSSGKLVDNVDKCVDKSRHDGTANLTPWKKGKSGNPKGSSKRQRERADYRRYFEEHQEDWDAIIQKGAEKAKRGDFSFWNAIMDRMLGKVPNKNQVTGDDGGPINLSVVVNSPEERMALDALRKKMSGE